MAFGDSITEGKTAARSQFVLLPPCPPPLGGGFDNSPISYPDVLIGLLGDRYTAQTLTMKPCGYGGESVATGRNRLANALAAFPPQALLLLEGANDLAGGGQAAVMSIASDLRAMAQYARGQGIAVFLATLTPVYAGTRAGLAPPYVSATNDQIRRVAIEERVTLVDLYQAFGGDPSLIDEDGLHPTQKGHQLIARTFFDSIKGRLELPPASTTAAPTATMRLRR